MEAKPVVCLSKLMAGEPKFHPAQDCKAATYRAAQSFGSGGLWANTVPLRNLRSHPKCKVPSGCRRKEGLRIGMLWCTKHLVRRAVFHDLAFGHHCQVITHL